MQKNALAVTVSTMVMGVFGAFLRWLQDRTIFDPETGLAARGAAISIVCAIYLALAFFAMLALVIFWLRRYEKVPEAGEALRARTALPAAVTWALCAVFAVGGLMRMFSAMQSVAPRFQRVFGAGAILSAACFPFLAGGKEGRPHPLGRLASAILALFSCFWLVFCYVVNEQNPVLWSYAPEILAITASTLAFYYICRWHYGAAKPNAALLFVQAGAFLNLCILPDSRSASATAMFAVTAALLLTLEFLMVNNLREPAETENEP